ncbi:hypothetical protein [Paludisphaera soli]|uniref:hypothetical protein n=1 Tax=Paludisphaera soli TaxID=2712865 RepID=UPI0013EC8615|nr:hypothetical protein [Paludisphaera soli]
MIRTLQAIGAECGVILDEALLRLLGLEVGSRVEVGLAPGGKGLLLIPLEAGEAGAEHRARVREASRRAIERHASAFRRLAE